jgi:hypothetical protein
MEFAGKVRKPIKKEKTQVMKQHVAKKGRDDLVKIAESVTVAEVRGNADVQVIERMVKELLSRADKHAPDAMNWLIKQSTKAELKKAIDAIDPKTCTKHTTESKLRDCAEVLFGRRWQAVESLKEGYGMVLESCNASVQYTFKKATADGRYDLGVLRNKMIAFMEFAPDTQASGSVAMPSAVPPVVAMDGSVSGTHDESDVKSDVDMEDLATHMRSTFT